MPEQPDPKTAQTLRYVEILEEIATQYFTESMNNSPPERYGTEGGQLMLEFIEIVANSLRTNIKQGS